MKNKFTGAISLAAAICVLSGCSDGETEKTVNIIDAGGASVSGSLFPGSMSDISSGDPPQGSSSSTDPEESSPGSSGVSPPSSSSSSTRTGSSSSSTRTGSSSSSTTSPSTGMHSYPAKPVHSSEGKSSFMGSTDAPPTDTSTSTTTKSTTGTSTTSPSTTITSTVPQSSSTTTNRPSSTSSQSTPPEKPSSVNTYKTLNYKEVKGVWISFLEIRDMPSSSPSEFRKAIGAVYDNCVSLGINTVYVHARSHGDAYYDSELFAYTKYISGGFDALEIMIDEAHKRDLSFQAWINPLRGCEVKDVARTNGYLLGDFIKDGKRAVCVNGIYYLNPAYDEVVKLISDGAAEIVSNYDVDGLHIDDYFYPTTDASFDSAAFKASSYKKLSDFRFANCDRFVKSLYSTVKSCNPSAVFGISCQGNLNNNYDYMYADVKKWCLETGYTDYIMPQIYFGFDNATQPFAECVKTWDNLAKSGNISLITGITFSKLGAEDTWAGNSGKREWITDKQIIKRQVLEAMEQQTYGGVCLFRYDLIFAPSSNVKKQVDEEVAALKTVLK